jgi:VIT1/CCC1 family predicted Fe2+/Mn2+ transporter
MIKNKIKTISNKIKSISILDRELLRPSIFGMFDGLTSLLGVVIPLLRHDHILIFITCFGLAVSSAISMGLGEYLSSDKDTSRGLRIKSSLYMAVFTGVGCFLPVVPYAFTSGSLAIAISIGIYLVLTLGVAGMKSKELGWKDSLAQTFLVSLAAIAIVVVATLGLPNTGG